MCRDIWRFFLKTYCNYYANVYTHIFHINKYIYIQIWSRSAPPIGWPATTGTTYQPQGSGMLEWAMEVGSALCISMWGLSGQSFGACWQNYWNTYEEIKSVCVKISYVYIYMLEKTELLCIYIYGNIYIYNIMVSVHLPHDHLVKLNPLTTQQILVSLKQDSHFRGNFIHTPYNRG